mgnify:CR=1 FL=1
MAFTEFYVDVGFITESQCYQETTVVDKLPDSQADWDT